MDTIFVQFMRYNKHRNLVLSNGFSHTYRECKNMGDFFWVQDDEKLRTDFKVEYMMNRHLPIENGRAYVSAFLPSQVFQSFYWGKMYPNMEIVIGGPAVLFPRYLRAYMDNKIPKNVTFRTGIMEEFFEIEKSDWGIEVPSLPNSRIFSSYTVNRGCYWGKCIFCGECYTSKKYFNPNHRVDPNFLPKGKWKIFFVNGSADPHFLSEDIPNLISTNDLEAWSYIRADKPTLRALEEGLNKCPKGILTFHLGVEFPSNRMLRIMKKGSNTDIMLQTIETLLRHDCTFWITMILGWNILTEEDVRDAEEFIARIKSLADPKKIHCHVVGLLLKRNVDGSPYKPLMKINNCEGKKITRVSSGEFICTSYVPVLSEHQKALNSEVKNLYLENFSASVSPRIGYILK